MKAVTWQGRRDICVEEVPDPQLQHATVAVIRITSTGLCGSDLHLYETLAPFMTPGDIVGHEPMGIVEEVGPDVTTLAPGDRVVVPFNVSCGQCYQCLHGMQSQCETTQNRAYGTGANLFGYSWLYGSVPGGQAEFLRVPFADFLPIKVPHGPSDERFLYLSDVLPTAWQAVEYADVPPYGSLAVLGCGPIGDMCCRVARLRELRVIAVDLVPERLARVRTRGAEPIDLTSVHDVAAEIRGRTGGRGPDAVIDAVGMEAHGSPVAALLQHAAGHVPASVARTLTRRLGVDRMAALYTAIDAVRRGGTVSVVGVYGGAMDPMPLMRMFDKQIQIRMGQANVRRWTDEIMPFLLRDDDPLGVEAFATHRLALAEAPEAYRMFQGRQDGTVKAIFHP